MSLLDTARAYISTPRNVPTVAAIAVTSPDRGRVAKVNARRLRHWSERSEWIRTAINIRKVQVAGAEWDITTFDPDGKIPDKGLQQEIKDRLDFANPKSESFRSFIEPIVEDILVLDAGAIEIEPNLKGEPLYLHGVDGATVRVSTLWDGTDPTEPRYFWYPDNFERGRWTNDRMIYIMETARTNSVIGFSKLETLAATIDAELEGHAFNARQVRNAAPDGLLHLGRGAKQENIDGFRAMWQAEQQYGAMAITGGTDEPKFLKFHDSNKDAQFLEWEIYLVRKIAGVMGMSPGDLGISHDINRSTAEVNDQQSEDRGIRPLLGLLAGHITREFVWSIGFGGQANNLQFRWTKLNLKESLAKAQINKLALAGMPYKAVNEARKEDGQEPWGPEFDLPAMVTPQGAFSLEGLPTMSEWLDIQRQKKAPPALPPGKSVEELVALAVAAVPRDRDTDLHELVRNHFTDDRDFARDQAETFLRMMEAKSQPISVTTPVTIADGAVKVDVAPQFFEAGALQVEQTTPEIVVKAPDVEVHPTPVIIQPSGDMAEVNQTLRQLYEALLNAPPPPVRPTVVQVEVERDDNNRIIRKGEHMSDGEVIWHEVERDADGRILGMRKL